MKLQKNNLTNVIDRNSPMMTTNNNISYLNEMKVTRLKEAYNILLITEMIVKDGG
jgi:hypothetical protein